MHQWTGSSHTSAQVSEGEDLLGRSEWEACGVPCGRSYEGACKLLSTHPHHPI